MAIGKWAIDLVKFSVKASVLLSLCFVKEGKVFSTQASPLFLY